MAVAWLGAGESWWASTATSGLNATKTLTPTFRTDWAPGEYAICTVLYFNLTAPTTPTGWALLQTFDLETNFALYIYGRELQSGDVPPTFSKQYPANSMGQATIHHFSGVDAATPMAGFTSQAETVATSDNISFPAITLTGVDSGVVAGMIARINTTSVRSISTPSSGFTEISDINPTGSSANRTLHYQQFGTSATPGDAIPNNVANFTLGKSYTYELLASGGATPTVGYYVKDAGEWKPVTELHVKDGGVWKPVVSFHVRHGGVWKQLL